MKYLKLYEENNGFGPRLSNEVSRDDVRKFVNDHPRDNANLSDLKFIKNLMSESLSRKSLSSKQINNVLDNIRLIKNDQDTLDRKYDYTSSHFITIVGSTLDSSPDYSTYVNLVDWVEQNRESVIGRSYVYKFEDEWWLIWHYDNKSEVPYIIDSIDGLREFFNTVYLGAID